MAKRRERRFDPAREFSPSSLSALNTLLFENIVVEIEHGRGDVPSHENFSDVRKGSSSFKPAIIPERRGMENNRRRGMPGDPFFAWDLDLFFGFIRKEISSNKALFEEQCSIWKFDAEGTFGKFTTERKLLRDNAVVIFCAAAQSGSRYDLTAFLARYISYCDNECEINGQSHRIRGVRGFEFIADELLREHGLSGPPKLAVDLTRQLLLRRAFDQQDSHTARTEINLDPYDHTSIELFGREQQIEELNALLRSSAQLLILPIIGPSGAGKTRLVTQWLREHVSNDWHAGLLEDPSDALRDWRFQQDTVIVIDYVFQYKAAIATIIRQARAGSKFRIRLILLDHVLPDTADGISASLLGSALVPSKRATADIVREGTILSAMRLTEAPNRLDILRRIIAAVSGHDESSANVAQGLQLLSGYSDGNHDEGRGSTPPQFSTDSTATAHPLFAILAGQAIANQVPIDNWRRRDVVDFYLNNERRLPWKCESLGKPARAWTGAFVAAATANGGLTFDHLFGHVPEDQNLTELDREEIVQHCNRITSSLAGDRLQPFRPDILGENFFLAFFQQYRGTPVVRDAFLRMAFFRGKRVGHPMLAQAGFVKRLVRNLLNEDCLDHRTLKHWTVVADFLSLVVLPLNRDGSHVEKSPTVSTLWIFLLHHLCIALFRYVIALFSSNRELALCYAEVLKKLFLLKRSSETLLQFLKRVGALPEGYAASTEDAMGAP